MPTARAYLESRGLPGVLAPMFGLVGTTKGIRIPVRAPWGTVVATLTRRTVGNGRYAVQEGSHSREFPYGLDVSGRHAVAKGYCAVCEGPFDCLALVAAGIPAVACLGSTLSPSQALWLSLYARSALLAFDEDDRGREGAQKAARRLRGLGVEVVSPPLPPGAKDPADVWRLAGAKEALKEWEEEGRKRLAAIAR
jgi:DNA primase